MLAQLKQIAVSKRNVTVNRVKLGTLKQDRGETVRKFAGRVKSLASVSGYTVKCSKVGCNTDVTYQEPVVIDQVIRGLSDSEIQKDVLARDRTDLETLLKYVEGKESALTSQGLMSGGAAAAANYEQRHGQQGRREQRRDQRGGQEHRDRCPNCGGQAHGSRKECKALDSECDTCGKIGHFAKMCRRSSNRKSRGQGKPEFELKRPLPPKKSQAAANAAEDANRDSSFDNCSLFINNNGRNKDFLYSSVVIGKQANLNLNQKELPARDCKTKNSLKEAKDKINKKELPARDCKTKDGEYFELKKRNDPLLVSKSYKDTLDSVMRILVVSAISATTITSDVLHHHVFDQHTQSWQQRPAKKKPFVRVTVKVDKDTAVALGMKKVNVKTHVITDRALPDTGASVTLTGTKTMRNIGITEADLTRCALRLYGADGKDIELLGPIPVIITDTQTGKSTKQVLYLCHKASSLLLSLEACEDLGYVPRDFADMRQTQLANKAAVDGKDPNCDCECPVRERAPDVPTALPFAPTPDNVPKIEQMECVRFEKLCQG